MEAVLFIYPLPQRMAESPPFIHYSARIYSFCKTTSEQLIWRVQVQMFLECALWNSPQMFYRQICVFCFCRCIQAWASRGHVVGTPGNRPPVPLPLPLLAGSWHGKMEPSAGHCLTFHYAKCAPSSPVSGFISMENKVYLNIGVINSTC